jgi:hypothetical protein
MPVHKVDYYDEKEVPAVELSEDPR